jgi:hypothetical protein
LKFVTVVGPSSVFEGSKAGYFGTATYYSGFHFNFTNTTWLATLFNITNGVFSPGIITSNTQVMLTAKFSSSGLTYNSSTNVTVLNLPPPLLKQPKLSGSNFTFQVAGVSNRIHVIEAATNLSPSALWRPLSTNTLGTTGLWNFTNAAGSSPQQFYRAREVDN